MSDTVIDKLAGINPLLSNMIVGVGGDQNYIHEQALPVIETPALTVTYRKGGNERLVAEGNTITLRAPGTLPRDIDVSFDTATVTLKQYAAGANVDYMDIQAANVNGGLDLKMAKLSAAKSTVLLDVEAIVCDLLGTAANYGANTSAAVDFAATGLRKTVMIAADAIRKSSGYSPNTLVIGAVTELEVLSNPDVQDMIKYSAGGVTTTELLARFFGVERVLVATALKQTAAAVGASGAGTYLFPTDAAALFYANRNAASPYNPSFAYFFKQPEAVFEWDNNPLIHNMAYTYTCAAPLCFATAGYLWTNTDQ